MNTVIPIHTQVEGRARYKINGLCQSPYLKSFLETRLLEHDDIRHVSASTITGNLLVSYNSFNTPQSIADLIDNLLDDVAVQKAFQDLPPMPASRPGFRIPVETPTRGSDRRNAFDLADKLLQKIGFQKPELDLPWHQLSRDNVLQRLESNLKTGLDADTAEKRFQSNGPNAIPEAKSRSGWRLFLEQFTSLPVYLLGAAAGVSLLTGGILDAAVIGGVVVANAAIGFVTESRAEKIIRGLNQLVKPEAEVLRDGQIVRIPAERVVIGDILILKPGAYVAADSRILKASHLSIDESMLTGESVPAFKHAKPLNGGDMIPLGDRTNMAYMGTLVTGGEGMSVVIATGQWTEIGHLQILLQETEAPETPIERQLGQMGDQLVLLCGAVCGLVFLIGFLRGHGFLQMLRMSISLAAAAVPEGLPAAATINFAMGISRMRKHRVLIRHLQAVETLGAIQTICLDKTGTITQNQMTVQRVFIENRRIDIKKNRLYDGATPVDIEGEAVLRQLLTVCILCNESKIDGTDEQGAYRLVGSSTENALIRLAGAAGMDVPAFLREYRFLEATHRSESRLFMSTLYQTKDGSRLSALKGSPPEVLALCDRQMRNGHIASFTEEDWLAIETENERMAGEALRVLGLAIQTRTDPESDTEDGFIWLGLVGMSDPVREGIGELIHRFHGAGIETIMITGDQSATAYAVANELKLSGDRPLEILDSSQLDAIEPEKLMALAKKANVYARVSPSHKLRIVQALQSIGKVVAMTGDGINDGPALKAADIGIAMGESGTDVARDVADVVLEKDNLETLTLALCDGRAIYGNIRKSVHFFLSTNISEIMLMFTAMGTGIGFPLNVMQLLWINIISDIFPGLALSMEAPEPDIMSQPPRDPHAPLFSKSDYKRMTLESAAITGGALAAYAYGIGRYGMGARAGSLAFQSLTIGQLLHAISCRSETHRIFDGGKLPSNPYLALALGGSLALQALTLVFPPLRNFLSLTGLSLLDTAVITASSVLPLLLNEATKNPNRRKHD